MPRVLVPLAEGCEEIETVTIIDLLRRAQIDVDTAALDGNGVTGSHDIGIAADMNLDAALGQDYDMIVLPGGLPGATRLEADSRLRELLLRMAANGRYTAAICAAPRVLAAAGLLSGREATSYPGFLDDYDVAYSTAPVVVDGKIITSRGPGTAMDFALTLIERLRGAEIRNQVESTLQRPSQAA